MIAIPEHLPEDIEVLKDIILELVSSNKSFSNKIEYLEREIRYLQEENKLLLQKMFGSKREKITSQEEDIQPTLFDEVETYKDLEEDAEEEIVVSSHTRKKRGRRPLPEELPRVEIIHDISEEEKRCRCGCELKRIGEEVSEKLDIIPPKIQVQRHIRYKYACKNCEGVESEGGAVKTASLPAQMIPQGIVTPGLLAWVIVSKFCDGLPFYRQEKLFERIGVELSRSTLSNWSILAYRGCQRLLGLLKEELKSSPLVGMDETTVQVMKEENRKDTTKSYMWVFRGGTRGRPVILFRYNPGRGEDFVLKEFEGYEGIIVTDGYSGYNKLGNKEKVLHAGCWAHVRRKFFEASTNGKDNKSFANTVLSMIKNLYEVESEIREKGYSEVEIQELRDSRSRPVVMKIGELLNKHKNNIAPKSLTGKAISYTLGIWPKLLLYLDNGIIPIDNNLVENAIRPFVVGRKNWLFSGSPGGADASAGLYSIIETAKGNGLEPYWYMRYLFEKLPDCQSDDEIYKLLPNKIDPDVISKFRSGVN